MFTSVSAHYSRGFCDVLPVPAPGGQQPKTTNDTVARQTLGVHRDKASAFPSCKGPAHSVRKQFPSHFAAQPATTVKPQTSAFECRIISLGFPLLMARHPVNRPTGNPPGLRGISTRRVAENAQGSTWTFYAFSSLSSALTHHKISPITPRNFQ
jgi:hypothetical protein